MNEHPNIQYNKKIKFYDFLLQKQVGKRFKIKPTEKSLQLK